MICPYYHGFMESSSECTFCKVNTIRRIFIDFMTGEVLEGHLPAKALALVREWLALHKDTLQTMWETQEFQKIPPLE